MYQNRSEYDRGVNTFSPEGRLFQVEYALQAIKLGSTAIGVQTTGGVVLAVERRIQSPLLEAASVEKIIELDHHLACAVSGLTADARGVVEHVRVQAQSFHFSYDTDIGVESVAQSVCDLALRFGEGVGGEKSIMSRPFGVALLLAGVDQKAGPQLFCVDPSGTYIRFKAKAIGAGSEAAQTELEEVYKDGMELAEGVAVALKVLKSVMEEKMTAVNIQVATVTPGKEGGYKLWGVEEIKTAVEGLDK